MENTGRIRKLLAPAARRILFSQSLDQNARDELLQMSYVDQAHLLMLTECGIIGRNRAARLVAAIDGLRSQDFTPLQHRPSTRGLFLLYEDYLIETEGPEVGGMLQTARSRNDLNATVLKLRLRRPYLQLLEEGLRLHAILLRRAKKYSGAIMPIYTHGQAAMPVTYGHYLAGIATALQRDFGGLLAAAGDMQYCPLGAGAVAGTSFPISTARAAQLLGFDLGPGHSIDAVASRDLVLRLLAAACIYSVNLGRLATDLLQWTTAEFDFLRLPDELVGSSSAMPQKRNPFLLEHVQGRAAALLGAFVHAATSMHSAPFTNSISVGTEAVKPMWGALQNLAEMILLMRLIVAGAEPNRETMLQRAVAGFTTATAFADHLVVNGKADFRTAHRLIGAAVLETLKHGNKSFAEVAAAHMAQHGISTSFRHLDPATVVGSLEFGGGPGPSSMKHCLNHLQNEWASHYRQKQRQKKHWRDAEIALEQAVQELLAQKQGEAI